MAMSNKKRVPAAGKFYSTRKNGRGNPVEVLRTGIIFKSDEDFYDTEHPDISSRIESLTPAKSSGKCSAVTEE